MCDAISVDVVGVYQPNDLPSWNNTSRYFKMKPFFFMVESFVGNGVRTWFIHFRRMIETCTVCPKLNYSPHKSIFYILVHMQALLGAHQSSGRTIFPCNRSIRRTSRLNAWGMLCIWASGVFALVFTKKCVLYVCLYVVTCNYAASRACCRHRFLCQHWGC